MYGIQDYGDMISDRGRTDAYAQALRARVNPTSVVLDIGAGPGILTLLACQAGARKVYAVEPDGVIEVARELVRANGYEGRVEFIQALSTTVDLPEQVDLIVSAIQGVLPLFYGSLRSILDARDRFLKPGGFLIPMRETISAAIVTLPASYRRIVQPWDNTRGLDCAAARLRAVNTWTRCKCAPASLVVEPTVWTVLDYQELQSTSARAQVSWTVKESCEAHGLCLWFDCETTAGCGFSNSPVSGEEHIFQQAFFPWTQACRLEPGDQATVDLRADVVGEDYTWSWDTEIREADGEGRLKARFRQSQFLSAPVSADWLRKSGASFVPLPNHEARIDKMILDLLFTGISLEEISRRASEAFPKRFPQWRSALTRVGEMSLRYSR